MTHKKNETEKESSYDVKHCQVLGEGNFGKVWKAEVDDICGYEGTILVAVKGVKASRKNKQRKTQTLTKIQILTMDMMASRELSQVVPWSMIMFVESIMWILGVDSAYS